MAMAVGIINLILKSLFSLIQGRLIPRRFSSGVVVLTLTIQLMVAKIETGLLVTLAMIL